MTEDATHLKDLISADDYAEHQRLKRLLDHARSDAPMSQKDLGELTGCSPSYISMIERRAIFKLRDQLLPHIKQLNIPSN